MKKVLVIGSCGAGKSTFARRLHEATGLKLIHLDRFYHNPNWEEPSDEEWFQTVEKLIGEDEWIIDGNYGGSMERRLARCDTAIWLDFPRIVCTWRVLKRTMMYRKKTRPDMAEGCNERFEWEFTKYVWNFKRDKNPALESRLAKYDEVKVFRLSSNSQVEQFFRQLKSQELEFK
jgi:adenylate kinase family enzyme